MLDEDGYESPAVKPYNYSSLPKTGGTYKDQVKLKEQNLYGSSRAGIPLVDLLFSAKGYTFNSYNGLLLSGTNTAQVSNPASQISFVRMVGQKVYEMANHLGNVLVTVTGGRFVLNSGSAVTGYNAVVKSAMDYSAFGVILEGRKSVPASGEHRYDFNGKETDQETDWQDYGFRIYNPKLGKFLSVDPLKKSYPYYTPYQFAGNKPIIAIDLDGLEEYIVTRTYNPVTGQVTSLTQFVPIQNRQRIVDNEGNLTYRNGVDYVFVNPTTDQATTIQMFDFIQGSKESDSRTRLFFYYPTRSDAEQGVNRQIGTLGNANGQTVAQGKPIVSGNPDRVLGGKLDTYILPSIEEFYTTNNSVVTTQNINAAALADYLIANPNLIATIDGYTDRVGSESSNMVLSQNRADGIRQAIINNAMQSGQYSQAQIDDLSTRLVAVGHGENQAAANGAPDNTPNAQDRTTKVTITPR